MFVRALGVFAPAASASVKTNCKKRKNKQTAYNHPFLLD